MQAGDHAKVAALCSRPEIALDRDRRVQVPTELHYTHCKSSPVYIS